MAVSYVFLLNQVWCFPHFQLLSKPKYSSVEKIKTIGSTYMAASGLQPGRNKKRVGLAYVNSAMCTD